MGGPSWAGTPTGSATIPSSPSASTGGTGRHSTRMGSRPSSLRLPSRGHRPGLPGGRPGLRGTAPVGRLEPAPAGRRDGLPPGCGRGRPASGGLSRRRRGGRADVFGERLALEVAHAIADIDPWPVEVDRSDWGSVTRSRSTGVGSPRIRRAAAADVAADVSLPLLELPTVADLERELAERKADLVARDAAGETRITMNPIRYHIAGSRRRSRRKPLGAGRPRSTARSGRPGSAIARSWGPRARSLARSAPRSGGVARPVTIFAGYSQGSLGYVATPDEYPHGGYEPAISIGATGNPPRSRPMSRDHRADRPGAAAGAVRVTGQDTKVSSARPDLGQAIAGGDRDRIALRGRLASRKADLPLRYWRQQAHLTTPAADASMARKAVESGTAPVARMLDRLGLTAADLAERLELPTSMVEGRLARSSRAPLVMLDGEDAIAPGDEVAAVRCPWPRRRSRRPTGATRTACRRCASTARPGST